MHKNATKCNETLSKWCKNKHGASKIIDTFETYQALSSCEKNQIKEEYCIHHRNEETRMWDMALNELAEKVCALYPFICELCYKMGHFNFQCSSYDSSLSNPMSTASLYCDDKITPNPHDELTLFLGV
jgi:hypothetical protein